MSTHNVFMHAEIRILFKKKRKKKDVLGFNDTSNLVSHLCRLPEKGRREIVEEMKESDRAERGK